MTTLASANPLSRTSEIGELCLKARKAIKRANVFLSLVVAIETMNLYLSDKPGAAAFALMGAGCCFSLNIWCASGIGLPLLPMMMFQNLVIYGLPIAVGHAIILSYPADFVFSAGIEVLCFDLAMIGAWKAAMQVFQPSQPVSYALQEFNSEGVQGWSRLGFGMIIGATGFEVFRNLNLANFIITALPSGADSILTALVAVASASGFLLVSMIVGRSDTSVVGKMVFWVLLVVNAMISASEFLLSSAAANLITVAIGFFWSQGRVPWRYFIVIMACLSFLNTGKTTMRERYWGGDYEPGSQSTIERLPAIYAEWIQVSYNAILENEGGGARGQAEQGQTGTNKNQTLLDRIDNLQNVLFVIDAMETEHITPLHGVTYALIPPLLVPRILWPDKPRSHEGQVVLNVHFGRQDLNSTYTTYIAWGLLPEAYGNFGPITGALVVGTFLGLFFAWIENFTTRKLVLSTEGFLSLSLLMILMNSFEMVASVLVTSIFQSAVIIICASIPFVHRTVSPRLVSEDG